MDEPVRLRAPLRCWHESLVSARSDAMTSLSVAGGFIATARPVPPGTPLFLEITIDAAATAAIDAVVVGGASPDEGFEVRFVGIDERTHALLERVLLQQQLDEDARARERTRQLAVDLEVTDRMERPANIPAPPPDVLAVPVAGLDETQPFVTAPRAVAASFELPRTLAVEETPPQQSAPTRLIVDDERALAAVGEPAVSAERSAVADFPAEPAVVPERSAVDETAPSWLVEATSDGSAVDETRRWVPAPRGSPLESTLPAWSTPAADEPPLPVVAVVSAERSAVVDAEVSAAVAEGSAGPVIDDDDTRPYVRPSSDPFAGLPTVPRLLTPLQTPLGPRQEPLPAAPSALRSTPLPKIASLDMPGGPLLPAVEDTMRWPTARLRVANAPAELPVDPPFARPPEVEESKSAPEALDAVFPDTGAVPVEPALLGDPQADDDDDHPPVASSRALFAAPGEFLGDPDELPVGGGIDFGGDIEPTDPGLRQNTIATAPLHTAEDVPLESLEQPLDVTLEEDPPDEAHNVDVMEVSDLEEYRDVLGAITAAPTADAATALMPRVLAQELQRLALPSALELPAERAGATQPYLTLKGADASMLDAPTARLPAFAMPPPPLTDLPQLALDAPVPADAFDPFAAVPSATLPPRSSTDVLAPGVFDAVPRSDPAAPVLFDAPAMLTSPPRSTTEVMTTAPVADAVVTADQVTAPRATAPFMPVWSGPPVAPVPEAPPPLPPRPKVTLRMNASELDADNAATPDEVSMPMAIPSLVEVVAAAAPVSALLGNASVPSWPTAADEGEVLSLDTPVEGAEGQIESFFDNLAFTPVEAPAPNVNPQPASSWHIMEERAEVAPPPPTDEEIPLVVGEDLPLVVGRHPTQDPFNGLDWIVGEPAKK